ncbi:hypothetical protein V2G26_005972 [Clonostachys chloroleuca]
MKSASRLFYLSLFALWAPAAICSEQEDCAISPKAIVQDACASYATLDRLNAQVKPALDDLTQTTDFFSHYRLNLFNKACPFWNDEGGMCANIGCAVETLDNEEDIPEVWRAAELGKLEGPRAKHLGQSARKRHPEKPLLGELGGGVSEGCVFEYDDECDERDYCVPEDESAGSKGDYVSLLRNPERFTGYGGMGSRQVWDAIYRENCFQRSSFPHTADLGSSSPKNLAQQDFKQVLDAAARQLSNDKLEVPSGDVETNDECLEKRVFYRVVSGMHASISTHLCWDFLNQTTGEWHPNLSCYAARLHPFPDRISNLYFNYALLTRAVAKLGPYLKDYTFCTGDEVEDIATRNKVLEVTDRAATVPQIFDEGLMFVNGEGPSLKEDFRNRFRNVSRIMDCVGCDKCRLWGKIQTSGYGTALKVLFEFDNAEDLPVLKRTELVALFNTHARLSSSLNALAKFRDMLQASKKEQESEETKKEPEPEPEESKKEPEPEESKKQPVPEESRKEPEPSPEESKKEPESKESVAATPNEMKEEKTMGSESTPPEKKHQKEPFRPQTITEQFKHEFGLVWDAVALITGSWYRAPAAFFHIFSSETNRFVRFWIGLPVPDRDWSFEWPSLQRDEL